MERLNFRDYSAFCRWDNAPIIVIAPKGQNGNPAAYRDLSVSIVVDRPRYERKGVYILDYDKHAAFMFSDLVELAQWISATGNTVVRVEDDLPPENYLDSFGIAKPCAAIVQRFFNV